VDGVGERIVATAWSQAVALELASMVEESASAPSVDCVGESELLFLLLSPSAAMVVPAELPVFVWVEVETLRWAQEQQVVVKARQVG
jgi:hypothetical protein